ncbi:MAG: PrsW family glutamic-type intramembrane protease, partial [Cytophagaceae bacterium]
MRKSFIITIGIFAFSVIMANLFLPDPVFDNLSDKVTFQQQANMPNRAEETLLKIIENDSFTVEVHYRFIQNHFDIPEEKKKGRHNYVKRDDNTIINFYDTLSQSSYENQADLGFYGKGLIQSNLNNYPAALEALKQVKNKDLRYFNNTIGYVYMSLDSLHAAEFHFRKEIENRGNLAGAYSNLIALLFKQDRMPELEDLLKNKETRQYFSFPMERYVLFKNFQIPDYLLRIFKRTFQGLNILGFVAAFLIMGSWIMYLRKLDIFEVEKWKYVLITVALGMLFTFMIYPLTDFNNLVLNFSLDGTIINDFFYCVAGIGALEELVKFIPFFVILRFTKAINEPFDYIKYASLSALGFAFIENLIYFNENNLYIIHGRALTAVVSHMFDASIIAYGLILNRYKRAWNPYLNFILFFALASLSHGFYDFWLINKSASSFSIITFAFLLASMFVWNSFKNNALNHSSFYDKDKALDSEKLQDYLLYSLSGILLFEYLALVFKFGPGIANIGLLSSVTSGTYLILFLSTNLSKVRRRKGEWAPIRYWADKE